MELNNINNTQQSVLQVMAGATMGGAEAFFERLSRELNTSVMKQYVLTKRGARADRLRESGVHVETIRFWRWGKYLTRQAIANAIQRHETPLVMGWMNRACAALPVGKHINIGRLGGYYPLRHYSNCDWLIGNTPDLKNWIIENGFPQNKVVYLPNFIDDKPGTPLLRSTLDTPEDVPLILCLGRLHPNKGFDVALEALARVEKAYCWIAGAGGLQHILKQKAYQLGIGDRIKFLGWRNDAADLLATADMFLCSSRHEPLGNIILEAWAQRCPVVAADAQGPRQLIVHNKTGLLCPVNQADKMAESINYLIGNHESGKEMANQALEELKQRFDQKQVLEAYANFFDSVNLDK